MILALKTDQPLAEVILATEEGKVIDTYEWHAHRTLARDLLAVIKERLDMQKVDFAGLTGVVVFQGPGSFTGLRIGITLANTLAYGNSIPVVGEQGEDWLQKGARRLQNGENDKIVLPHYGGEAHITKPKK